MDWLDRFNAAIEYIENNLDGEIDYSFVARTACCSEYHFSRMFSSLAGIPLSEYIRRRRLTKAAFDIQAGREKIIDVAVKYGYDSSDAFTRAFKSCIALRLMTPGTMVSVLKPFRGSLSGLQ